MEPGQGVWFAGELCREDLGSGKRGPGPSITGVDTWWTHQCWFQHRVPSFANYLYGQRLLVSTVQYVTEPSGPQVHYHSTTATLTQSLYIVYIWWYITWACIIVYVYVYIFLVTWSQSHAGFTSHYIAIASSLFSVPLWLAGDFACWFKWNKLQLLSHCCSLWGCTSTPHKLDALIWAISLETGGGNTSENQANVEAYARQVISNLSDQGP